jgi:DDRGK domain
MVSDGPFGSAGDIGVGFSDNALIAVSILGFAMLSVTVYSIVVRRVQTRDEFDKRELDEMQYDEKLEKADIATLNRAQRRARAKTIMKKHRRVALAPEYHAEDDETETRQLSRRERERAAKAAEKHERKLFEDRRLELHRQAQLVAQQEKKERERLEAKRTEEGRKMHVDAMALQELKEYQAWNTFLSSAENAMSVVDLLLYLKANKSILIDDLSEQFRVPYSTIVARIQALVKTCRLTGVMVDNGKRFLYLTHEELVVFADAVRQNGETTLEGLIEVSKSISSS